MTMSYPKVVKSDFAEFLTIVTNNFITEMKVSMSYGDECYPLCLLFRGGKEVDASSLFSQLSWIYGKHKRGGLTPDDDKIVERRENLDYLHTRLDVKYPSFDWTSDLEAIKCRFERLMNTDGSDFIEYLKEKLSECDLLEDEDVADRWKSMMRKHDWDFGIENSDD